MWTAAHCLYDRQNGRFYNPNTWSFVPGYNRGRAPYGRWFARDLWVPAPYIQSGNLKFDFGAAVLTRNRRGARLGNVVGWQGFAWNVGRDRPYLELGYPAGYPFNGQALYYCNSRLAYLELSGGPGLPSAVTGCDFTEGSSGGPWLINFQRRTGTGYVNSVTSHGPPRPQGSPVQPYPPLNIGPFHGKLAHELWVRASRT